MSAIEQNLSPELDSSEGAGLIVPPGSSVLDFLHEKKEQLAAEEREPLIIPVATWGGALGVKFDYPEAGAEPIIRASFRLAQMDPKKAVDAAIDIILGAVVDIVGRRPTDPDWLPINPNGAPTRFGPTLASMLGFDIPAKIEKPHRYMVRLLWSPKFPQDGKWEGDLALIEASGDVGQWLRRADQAAESMLEGE